MCHEKASLLKKPVNIDFFHKTNLKYVSGILQRKVIANVIICKPSSKEKYVNVSEYKTALLLHLIYFICKYCVNSRKD